MLTLTCQRVSEDRLDERVVRSRLHHGRSDARSTLSPRPDADTDHEIFERLARDFIFSPASNIVQVDLSFFSRLRFKFPSAPPLLCSRSPPSLASPSPFSRFFEKFFSFDWVASTIRLLDPLCEQEKKYCFQPLAGHTVSRIPGLDAYHLNPSSRISVMEVKLEVTLFLRRVGFAFARKCATWNEKLCFQILPRKIGEQKFFACKMRLKIDIYVRPRAAYTCTNLNYARPQNFSAYFYEDMSEIFMRI